MMSAPLRDSPQSLSQGLPQMVVAHRWSALAGAGVDDLLLVTDRSEIRWLTGFSGTSGTVLVDASGGHGVLFTDTRYDLQARDELAATAAPVKVHVGRSRKDTADALAAAVGGRAVSADPRHLTVAQWQAHRETLPDVRLRSSPIETARRRKDGPEIARMRTAAAIASAALAETIARGLDGFTEREVALSLEQSMVAAGAEGPAYPTIVASGPNAAMPHHRAGDRTIREGDAVVIDVGARVDGYCSDMTRTFFVGDPDPELLEMHDLVVRAQRAGVEAVRVGVAASEVDRVCRELFAEHGRAELFGHGTGHGVGLDIHETPVLAPGVGDLLLPDEVVTVEPGLYREGLGGVRIEDLVVVSPEGATSLTDAPKEPTCPQSRRTT